MCLGFANFLVPPSPRARNIADYLKVVLVLHFGLAVCEIAAFRWFDGAFDILFALIGVLAIRNPEGYSLQQTMCYFLVCGFNCIWTVIRVIMFFSGVELFEAPSYSWQLNLRIFTMVAGPVVNFLAAVVGYKLYRELKLELNPMYGASEDAEDPYGGGGMYGGNGVAAGGQAPAGMYGINNGGAAAGGAAPAAPAPAAAGGAPARSTATPAGFRAFSGQGHVLGG